MMTQPGIAQWSDAQDSPVYDTSEATLVLVPTPLIALTQEHMSTLLGPLTQADHPNTFPDKTLLDRHPASCYWFDLAQLSREVPDFLRTLKQQVCEVRSGCRITTTSEAWLHTFDRRVQDGLYQGTCWCELQYAVVTSSAITIASDLRTSPSLAPLLFWQHELPITSLQVIAPIPMY